LITVAVDNSSPMIKRWSFIKIHPVYPYTH